MIYRLYKTIDSERPDAATTVDVIPGWSFLFVVSELRYQTFKSDIASGVELQDPDGNKMTKAKVNAFLKTLP